MIKKFMFGIIIIPEEKLMIKVLPDINKLYGVVYIFINNKKENIEFIKSKIDSEFIILNNTIEEYPEILEIEDIKKFDHIINKELNYDFNIILKLPGIWEFDKKYRLPDKEKNRLEETLTKIL